MIPNKQSKMKKVNSEYNVPIVVKEKQVIIDELNSENYEYVDTAIVWARIIPQTARMANMPNETRLTKVTHKIVILYGAAYWVKENMRFTVGDRDYDIEFVLDPYEEHSILEFYCEEVRT